MNHVPNRAEKRRNKIFDHPAYIWAIESDRPQWWAVELAASYNIHQLSFRREKQLGHRLTFTKFNGIKIKAVTGKALLCVFKSKGAQQGLEKWIPRSNIRSDDDNRMSEVQFQLQSHDSITTHLHIADWFVSKEGLAGANNPV